MAIKQWRVLGLVIASASLLFGFYAFNLNNSPRSEELPNVLPIEGASSSIQKEAIKDINIDQAVTLLSDNGANLEDETPDRLQRTAQERLASESEPAGQIVSENAEVNLSAKEIAKLLRSSTVTVRAKLADGVGLGSGFFLEDSRTLVTCLHVVRGAQEILVEFPGGKKAECLVFQALSEPWDLVILRTRESLDATPLTMARTTPEQGESVYTYGAPKGFSGTLSSGLVSAIRDNDVIGIGNENQFLEGTKLIQFTAAVSPGSSGGPVVDERGFVVGVAASQWATANDVNFAIDVTHLAELIEQAKHGRENLLTALPERPNKPEGLKHDEFRDIAKDILSEMKKQREEVVKSRQANEAIADRVVRADDRKLRLTQLQARISAGNAYLRRLESEKSVLSERYRRIEAEGSAVWESGMQLKQQVLTTKSYIRGVENELINRQQALLKGIEYQGDPRTSAALAQDLQRLRDTLVGQEAEARRLEAKWLGLDQEARALNQRYASMKKLYYDGVALRDSLMIELEALRVQVP